MMCPATGTPSHSRRQYLGNAGSIRVIQARIPPFRFRALLKPASRSSLTAFPLRIPDLQWTIMSSRPFQLWQT